MYARPALKHGYFATPKDAEIFDHELKHALIHQVFSFNSPVWFNVGTASPQQVSRVLHPGRRRHDGLDPGVVQGRGPDLQGRVGRGREPLPDPVQQGTAVSGGTASGPVSFMRGADASAGTIKSGGATRRAAKMVVLDVDHPDVEEFIQTKAREEDKIRVLRDAGYDMDLGGKDIASVQYQNANNSVRVSDEFMRPSRRVASSTPRSSQAARSSAQNWRHFMLGSMPRTRMTSRSSSAGRATAMRVVGQVRRR